MKTVHRTVFAVAFGLAFSAGAQAATVAFEYTDPQDFRDIRATEQGQKNFERDVLSELEEQFREEAAALPDGQTLRITMVDVDLAGDVEYFHRAFPFGVRVIRDIDFPQMQISYELRNAAGEVIQSGDDKIADMSFRFPTYATHNHIDQLDYEKALISDWYDDTFGS
jgi:hypothetical protein